MKAARCFLTAAMAFSAVEAQPTIALPPATGELRDTFSLIISVRELPDGRVLIADRKERRLVVASWSDGQTRLLGRVGRGPGEYRSLRQLLPLGSDSTLLVDTQQRRLIVIEGADSTVPFPVEHGLRITRFDAPIRGIDRKNRFIVYSAIPNPVPGVVPAHLQRPIDSDSVLIIRATLWQPGVDTLARIRGRFRGETSVTRTDGSRLVVFELGNPLGVEDQAWMFPDGWMALVLASPFRVDWLTPSGQWIRGHTLPWPRMATSDQEKTAAINRYSTGHLKPSDFIGWPAFIPPFPNDALLPMPDGRIAVEQTITSSSTSRMYVIIDRAGELVARLQTPLNSRIAAFGREFVYLVTRDELDLERLTRHPVPKF